MSVLKVEVHVEGNEKLNTVYLTLEDRGSYIVLDVVNENGFHVCAGNLLQINKESGRIKRCTSVHKNIGLPLDSRGRVEFCDEEA